MKTAESLLIGAILLGIVGNGFSTAHYVDVNSANPSPPYTSWATAAPTIQDAVDVAVAGDHVVVTNGTYATGGRAVDGTMTNRVVIDKAVAVQSVNGPVLTIIRGYQLPGVTNGDGAIRCVYIDGGASLSGFTLAGGATRDASGDADTYSEQSGGAVWCESDAAVVSNCVLVCNSATFWGGGAYGGTLNNCAVSNNWAGGAGGGGHSDFQGLGTLNNCTLSANTAAGAGGGGAATGNALGYTLNNCNIAGNFANHWGGGVLGGTLNYCVLSANSATSGGGASGLFVASSIPCTLNNCILNGNSAQSGGGGANVSTLNNCTLTGNSATYGGGATGCTLNNCRLSGNFAQYGGGADVTDMNNCTLAGNSATNSGGGAYGGNLTNCILWLNVATNAANYDDALDIFPETSILAYCCTTPLPVNADGGGNLDLDPMFVDQSAGNLRLQSNSTCINAGNNSFVVGNMDLDGRPRIVGGTVDMGAYEFQGPGMGEFIGWLQQYGLPTDGSADYADSDGDGMSNWQEWQCGTDPTDPLSALKLLPPINASPGISVTWQSVAGVSYTLLRSTNLVGPAPMFTPVAGSIPGQPSITTYVDTNAIGPGPLFYRVGVGN